MLDHRETTVMGDITVKLVDVKKTRSWLTQHQNQLKCHQRKRRIRLTLLGLSESSDSDGSSSDSRSNSKQVRYFNGTRAPAPSVASARVNQLPGQLGLSGLQQRFLRCRALQGLKTSPEIRWPKTEVISEVASVKKATSDTRSSASSIQHKFVDLPGGLPIGFGQLPAAKPSGSDSSNDSWTFITCDRRPTSQKVRRSNSTRVRQPVANITQPKPAGLSAFAQRVLRCRAKFKVASVDEEARSIQPQLVDSPGGLPIGFGQLPAAKDKEDQSKTPTLPTSQGKTQGAKEARTNPPTSTSSIDAPAASEDSSVKSKGTESRVSSILAPKKRKTTPPEVISEVASVEKATLDTRSSASSIQHKFVDSAGGLPIGFGQLPAAKEKEDESKKPTLPASQGKTQGSKERKSSRPGPPSSSKAKEEAKTVSKAQSRSQPASKRIKKELFRRFGENNRPTGPIIAADPGSVKPLVTFELVNGEEIYQEVPKNLIGYLAQEYQRRDLTKIKTRKACEFERDLRENSEESITSKNLNVWEYTRHFLKSFARMQEPYTSSKALRRRRLDKRIRTAKARRQLISMLFMKKSLRCGHKNMSSKSQKLRCMQKIQKLRNIDKIKKKIEQEKTAVSVKNAQEAQLKNKPTSSKNELRRAARRVKYPRAQEQKKPMRKNLKLQKIPKETTILYGDGGIGIVAKGKFPGRKFKNEQLMKDIDAVPGLAVYLADERRTSKACSTCLEKKSVYKIVKYQAESRTVTCRSCKAELEKQGKTYTPPDRDANAAKNIYLTNVTRRDILYKKKSPAPKKKSPAPRKKSPALKKKSPAPKKKSPALKKKSPAPKSRKTQL